MSPTNLKVIQVPLASLVEDANNPNHMEEADFAALVDNIAQVGFLQPILVKELEDSSFQIVDGHHRARAAGKAGLARVSAVVWDGSEEVRSLLAIGMNKLRGVLNLGEVARIVSDLSEQGWGMADLKLTGYSDAEIEDLLKAAQPKEDEDVLEGAKVLATESDDTEEKPRAHVLELTFQNANELARAKRALKRAADGGELGDGLINILAKLD